MEVLMAVERTVRMEIEEWQRVLGVLAQAPWGTVNPLILKIGEQLRVQEAAAPEEARRGNGADPESALAP
jgi:hypothetical protein